MHSRAHLDIVEKRRIPFPCWESNPDSLVIQRMIVTILTELHQYVSRTNVNQSDTQEVKIQNADSLKQNENNTNRSIKDYHSMQKLLLLCSI
jgi:hypothetical protein